MDALDLIKEGRLKRYFMARKKTAIAGAVYHVTQRAPGREPLFVEEADYLYMLHLLKEKSQKFKFEVLSFVLMPNHLHIQITLGEPNLSEAMKNIFETYAIFFNNKYERKGHVFCGGFRCALCLDEAYLIATSLYIHLNPLKAGLANDPVAYRWSSCGIYLSPKEKQTFINHYFILKILNEEINKAQEIYKNLLQEGARIKSAEVLENPAALELFKLRLIEFLPSNLKPAQNLISDKELDEKINNLKDKQRLRSPQKLEARKFLIEQLRARGYTVTQIAEKFNLTRPSIYAALNFTNR